MNSLRMLKRSSKVHDGNKGGFQAHERRRSGIGQQKNSEPRRVAFSSAQKSRCNDGM